MPREPLNVVMAYPRRVPLSEECQRRIRAVSSRIKLWDVSDLVDAEMQGDFSSRERLDALLAEAEIFYGFPAPREIIARAPKLKWIQASLAGVDPFLTSDIIASSVILTKARIHATQIGEAVLNVMLMLARHSFQHFRFQQEKKWQPLVPTVLRSKTVGIVGFGNVGQAIARLARAFGMRVVVMKARPMAHHRYADVILSPTGLRELLMQSDFVVLILPITPETKKLIGEVELRAMKSTAYLINVARGGIVDEEALIRALSESWIAGAALDAFATDPLPLPADSTFWDLPNVIITPHNAGDRADYADLLTQLFCQNLKRYLSGKELLNVVDKSKGY